MGRLRLRPIPSTDTIMVTMACLIMAMVDNGATGPMEDGPTMVRGLLMPKLQLKLMLIPPMDTMDTLTTALVETMDMDTEDTVGGKLPHYQSLLLYLQQAYKNRRRIRVFQYITICNPCLFSSY